MALPTGLAVGHLDAIRVLLRLDPYAKYNLAKLLENLSNKIKVTTLIGLETSVKDNIIVPENLNLLQKKTYGKTKIYFFKLS